MKFLKTKTWTPLDITSLKWACTLFGIIIGAYVSTWVKEHLWLVILGIIVFTIRPFYAYWIKKD